jgi:hypothetical protein
MLLLIYNAAIGITIPVNSRPPGRDIMYESIRGSCKSFEDLIMQR